MVDVSFHQVSKRYRIKGPAEGGRAAGMRDFWAVKDVSFDVARGETLGLIGHNGAGKSTILKLLSRITTPTSGEIRLRGRLAALIEVGSGFHPELTGRENVYLSGSILGMKRREIREKFDRIVEFSGVSEFIDTPVKWYSSGMYVRLGFAVAAHLDPDILLVDEVLAVGDAAFQVQCIERLNELRHSGTTMIFISHDLTSIEKLCDRVGLMQRGQLIASGAPHEVVSEYQEMAATSHAALVADAAETTGAGRAKIERITFASDSGAEITSVSTGAPLATRVHYTASTAVDEAVIEVFYYSEDGRVLLCQQSTAIAGDQLSIPPGPGSVEFLFPAIGLQPGIYSVGATIRQRNGAETIHWFYGGTMLYVQVGRTVRGYFYAPHDWRLDTERGNREQAPWPQRR
jgi:ABC-type polysaccharide/polyol phosphate transport system ATPase subunit